MEIDAIPCHIIKGNDGLIKFSIFFQIEQSAVKPIELSYNFHCCTEIKKQNEPHYHRVATEQAGLSRKLKPLNNNAN